MLSPEEENDAQVRREDQQNINRFARLNARLHQVRSERAELKKQLEGLDDACTELVMLPGVSGDGSGSEDGDGEIIPSPPCQVMMQVGEAWMESTEAEATAFCETEVERVQEQIDELEQEEGDILREQATLKTILYGRFGKSINLEEDPQS